MISARSITKSYGDVEVLRGVTLQVDRGTIHGFVGPNGAGKSTFLKSLVGVVRPCSGELLVDGLDVFEAALPTFEAVFGGGEENWRWLAFGGASGLLHCARIGMDESQTRL